MMRRTFLVAATLALSTMATHAQNGFLKGRVADSDGQPLMGATVNVEGTTRSVITDAQGNFAIEAKPGQKIRVTYIGFTPQTLTATAQPMVFRLSDDDGRLGEVVVVGASMKKSDLTGSVSVVGEKELTQKPVTTLNDALQGRVAGVFVSSAAKPSDDSYIKVRGTNTINSGSAPIYVVDGLVMGNDFSLFSALNVNEIESVTVLKDASATALYGSRGANGVIVVTTKRARRGEGTVSYDGWLKFTSMGHRPSTMNAQQTFDLRLDAFANGYMYEHPEADRQAYIDETLMNSTIAFHPKEMEGYRSGKSYDWLKPFIQTGVTQNHNVSFRKGTDNSSIYVGLNLTNLTGVVVGTKQKKFSGRINADTDIKKWLKVGTNTSYTYTQDRIPSDDVYNMALTRSNPLIDYAPYQDDAIRHNPEYLMLFWRAESEENNNYFNPFNSREVRVDRQRYYLMSSNYMNIHPMEGLDIRSTFAISHAEQGWFRYIPTDIQESFRHTSGDARADQQRWSFTEWQWDNTVTYEKSWKQHRLNAMAGTSTSRRSSNFGGMSGRRFPSNDLLYYNMGAAADNENKGLSSDWNSSSLVSFVGRANYNYAMKYYATVTFRYDGSSKFAKGHKWGFMPSFSLAWDLTRENFMVNQDVISRLKLRAGYGVTGNQDISNYAYVTLYTPSVSNGTASYATDGRRGTPGLTWEKQRQANLGVDLGLLGDRLSMTLDAFFTTNSDLLMTHGLPTTSGYTYTIENIG